MVTSTRTGRIALLAALLGVGACGASATGGSAGTGGDAIADAGPIGGDGSVTPDIQGADAGADANLPDAALDGGADTTVITKDVGTDDVPTLTDTDAGEPDDVAGDTGGPDDVGPDDVGQDVGEPDTAPLHQSVFGVTSGGGLTGSTNYGCRLIIGGPMGGAVESTNYRATFGVGTLSNQ